MPPCPSAVRNVVLGTRRRTRDGGCRAIYWRLRRAFNRRGPSVNRQAGTQTVPDRQRVGHNLLPWPKCGQTSRIGSVITQHRSHIAIPGRTAPHRSSGARPGTSRWEGATPQLPVSRGRPGPEDHRPVRSSYSTEIVHDARDPTGGADEVADVGATGRGHRHRPGPAGWPERPASLPAHAPHVRKRAAA